MNTRALILAAGHSTRMGHPKALTDLRGQTALARLVETCAAVGLLRPCVIVGRDAASICEHHLGLDVEWVVNAVPDAGRTGSIQCGLGAMQADSIVLAPIDHPLVASRTLRALLETPGDLTIPTYRGKGGHPLRLGQAAQAAILRATADTPLRDVLSGVPSTRLPVDDPAILANLDSPDDVARALGASHP